MNRNDEKDKPNGHTSNEQENEASSDFKNPFKPGEDEKISQEEIDKEQQFKEALTERD